MPELTIVLWGDPVLSEVAEPVPDSGFGPKLEAFGRDLVKTMKAHSGIGLAAPQVGVSERIFAMTFPDHDAMGPIVVVNPILVLSGKTLYEREGCLSFPNLFAQVPRSSDIVMEYRDPLGEEHELPLAGWDARVAQHEWDHTMGIMFFDRVSRQMRRSLLREWRKR